MESNNTKGEESPKLICPESKNECVQHQSQCSTVCWELQYGQRVKHGSIQKPMDIVYYNMAKQMTQKEFSEWLFKVNATPSKGVERGERAQKIKLNMPAVDILYKHVSKFDRHPPLEAIIAAMEEYRQSSEPLPEGKGVEDVKELTEVLELDGKLNTYVNSHGSETYIELQRLFWTAVDAINKAKFTTPNPSPKGVEGLQKAIEFFDSRDPNYSFTSQQITDFLIEFSESRAPLPVNK